MATSAKDELELLERVFLRVASAETDDQLQRVVGNFLTPLLLKTGSPHQDVKNKVMTLLTHLNKRLKSRPKIQLPIDSLLSQYQDPTVPAFVNNFTILYIRMGFPRLLAEKQVELAPFLVKCIQDKPQPQQDCLLQLVLPVLGQIKMPESEEGRSRMFEFQSRPAVAQILLEFLLDVLLMPYRNVLQQLSVASSSDSRQSSTESAATEQSSASATTSSTAPPGLSVVAMRRVSGDSSWEPNELERVKLGVLKFLASDLFDPSYVICHFLVATGDSRHSVLDTGEHELKRLSRSTDFEDAKVVNKMFAIFQGTAVMPGVGQQLNPDRARSPAGIRLKQKIFPYFLRSRRAADQFPACIQIIFESLFGQEPNAKLRVFAVQFVHHVCLWSSDKVMTMMGPLILNGMTKLIGEDKQEPQLRRLGYTAIGKLAKRLPRLFSKDVGLIQKLFQALCQEQSDTRLAVQEALSMMAPSYKKADGSTLTLIEALILNYVEQDTHQARLVAVQFANAVFPRVHVSSRYVCMLAIADVKDDVKEEAKRGLRSTQLTDQTRGDTMKSEEQLPAFPDMVSFVALKGLERLKGKYRYTAGTASLPFNPPVFSQVLLYLKHCLEHAAGVSEEDRVKSRTLIPVCKYVQRLVANVTSEEFPVTAIGKYIELIRQALQPIGGADLHAVALCCLLQVVAVAPERLAGLFHDKLDWIKGFTTSNREEARHYSGKLLAIITCTMNEENLVQLVRELSTLVESELFELQLGSVSTLGFVIARHLYLKTVKVSVKDEDVEVEDMEVEEHGNVNNRQQEEGLLADSTRKIVKLIDSRNTLISCSACNSVGEIGRSSCLPLPAGEQATTQEMSKSQPTSAEPITKLTVVEKLIDRLHKAKENKVQERAAHALGFLLVGDEHFPHHKRLIEGLCEASKIRQVELQFTVGEALSCAGAGRLSEVARDPWALEQLNSGALDKRGGIMQELIDTIVHKHANSGIPYVRQAACIWLLSLVKYSGEHRVVQANLKEIQLVFMNMLAETDELTQEVASKGLGLVYELGGEDRKDELVSLLVDTLMTGRRRTQQVTGDTKIFDEGELGRAPEGGGLSTYKELCSIASDLNQPDLIYKFMHLANHNAMWNSRKGAAFGFSSIAALSREQLEPYLPKIVPKLFRYQYDPNVKIQQAMSSIWAALVPETKNTVDKYMKEILQDLINSLGSNLWRVRQSRIMGRSFRCCVLVFGLALRIMKTSVRLSLLDRAVQENCMALSDLLSGRPVDDILESIPTLWELCFRGRDDIKESVRQAAEVACRTLSKVSIRVCDVNQGKLGETAIALVLPTLLHKGLGSRAEEVRAVSLSTILKISKNAGTLLKPHIPLLVIALLESLSGLENQSLNYLSLQLHKSEEVQEKLEGARIAASKMSPMMETINMCVQYVDESVLPELVPRLSDLLRTGVGLGTKAGSAGFVVSLSMQCQQQLTPFAGKLLGALLSGLSDRSASVRKSYATAIGHLVKVAKDSSIEKIITKITTWYFEKEDDGLRLACGLTLQAMTRYSPDVVKRHTAKVLPAVFFAMHEKKNTAAGGSSTSTESVWEEIWLENTPGTEAGIRLFLEEIVAITCPALTSQSWSTKAQAAVAISAIALKLGSSLSQPHLGQLLAALVSGLTGRTWTGKETLLDAISVVCLKCRQAIEKSSPRVDPDIEKVLDAVFKECRKENRAYKMAALKCFGEIVQEYSADRFQELSELLYPIIAPEPKKDGDEEEGKNEEDEEEDKDKPSVNQEFLVCAYDSLGQAWPKSTRESQDKHGERFCSVLAKALTANTWRVQLAVLGAMRSFIHRMDWISGTPSGSTEESIDRIAMLRRVLDRIIPPICECLEVKKYAAVRLGAVEALETVQSVLQGSVRLSLLREELKEHILDSLKFVYNDKEPKIREKAAELKKSLLLVSS